MRIFLFTLIGIPIIVADGILLWALPPHLAGIASRNEGLIALAGALAYLIVHFALRKPERMYVWAHELAHLMAAKLFLRTVHQFQISSRQGGKVVIDGTNVVIDLAPYIIPLYSLLAAGAAVLLRRASLRVPAVYLGVAAFLFTMHAVFSAEGIAAGQPDVKRSGRLFSAGLVFLFLLLWIPALLAPGTTGGWRGALTAYDGWFRASAAAARKLLLLGLPLLRA